MIGEALARLASPNPAVADSGQPAFVERDGARGRSARPERAVVEHGEGRKRDDREYEPEPADGTRPDERGQNDRHSKRSESELADSKFLPAKRRIGFSSSFDPSTVLGAGGGRHGLIVAQRGFVSLTVHRYYVTVQIYL